MRYLVTKDFKFPQFRLVLRKNFTLNDKTNIFFYQGAHLVAEDTNIKDIYNSRKDKQDGFLYLTYSDMEVFGSLTNHWKMDLYIVIIYKHSSILYIF